MQNPAFLGLGPFEIIAGLIPLLIAVVIFVFLLRLVLKPVTTRLDRVIAPLEQQASSRADH